MKKILGISLVAMMAVTAANAEIASKAYVLQQDKAITDTIGTLPEGESTVIGYIASVASGASSALDGYYTKGEADNAFVEQSQAATTSTAGIIAIASAEEIAAGESTTKAVTPAQLKAVETIASAKQSPQTTLAGYGITDAYTKTEADTAFVEQSQAATTSTAGIIKIADATDITNGSTTTAVTPAQLATVATTAGNALTSSSALKGANITAGTVPETALDTATQNKIDGAVQETSVQDTYTSTSEDPISGKGVADAIDGLSLGTMATETAANYTKTADMDSSVNATAGKVVTAISMTDGTLSTTVEDPLTQANYDTQATGVSLGDGSYVLTMKVVDTVPTYKWELVERSAQGN